MAFDNCFLLFMIVKIDYLQLISMNILYNAPKSIDQFNTRLASRGDLFLETNSTFQYGIRSIEFTGARLWNILPVPLTLIHMGGGEGKFAPQAVFCYSSTFLLQLSFFAHHLVYFLVTRDLTCCHGNPILNRCLAKNRPKSESNFNFVLQYKFELDSLRNNEITKKLLITDIFGCRDKARVRNDVIFKQGL